ncbi:MAG: ABC transporter permease [Deltaproteobacteria bacterium]|nr:ABC transporter permease [Deltaproteobacteria bacterium]
MDPAPIVQWRVIYALMMREVHTIYGTTRLGYLWALVHTMWHICIFWGIRTVMGVRAPHGMHILIFLLVGFGTFHVFSKSINKCMSAVSANKALLTFPQVTPVDLMISRVIIVWCTEMTAGFLFVCIGLLCGIPIYLNDIGGLLAFLLLTPLLGLGVGMICASLAVLFPTLEQIIPMGLRIMFFVSGLFFSATRIPSDILKYLWYNPILQIIEWGRYCLSRGYPVLNYSLPYLIVLTVSSLCLGLLFERYVRRRLK